MYSQQFQIPARTLFLGKSLLTIMGMCGAQKGEVFMSQENFQFTFEENEEGFTVKLKGDKEKLRTKLEAFEAFLNFREKARQAGYVHHDSESPVHQFFKTMHKHHAHHAHHAEEFRHCGHHTHSKNEAPFNKTEENKKPED